MSVPFCIEKIEIRKFKKIENASFDLTPDANVFYGGLASGKTSVAEFLVFLFYGADAVFLPMRRSEDFDGTVTLICRGERYTLTRSLVGGRETVSFTGPSGEPVSCETTPGEYLTGMDKDTFDLAVFFEPGRSGAHLKGAGRSILERIAGTRPETGRLYSESTALEKELKQLCNEEKSGSLDRVKEKKDGLLRLIEQKPALEKELAECRETISRIETKIDENDKRVVILKADLAGFTDDQKLLENKENAQALKRDIQLKEKKLKLLNFDLNGKIGKLSRPQLEELKEQYNVLSLSISELSEARSHQTVAEEHLSYHRSLFSDAPAEDRFDEARKDLRINRTSAGVMRVIGIVMIAVGVLAGVLLAVFGQGFALALSAAVSLALVGVACFFLSRIFRASIRRILSEFSKDSIGDFEREFELLKAHAKVEEIYSDLARSARRECEEKAAQTAESENAISRSLATLGYTEEDGEILAICDDIIEANETYFDLEDDIETEKKEYDELLRADVSRDNTELSAEFVSLEKELDFLSRQNESLVRRRAALEKQGENILGLLRDEKETAAEIEALSREEEELQKRYRSLQIDRTLTESRKAEFEKALKVLLESRVNEKLAFRLAEGERYVLDENFELCYSENDRVLPFSGTGSGIEELGYLALRLSVAELLTGESDLFIFDDPFAFLDSQTAKDLAASLTRLHGQSLVTTSSEEVVHVLDGAARIFPL